MSFQDPIRIWQVIQGMVQASQPRARNRARINSLFNGNAPFTEEEARDNRIATNVNFLEGTRVIASARQQATNGMLKPARYFSINLDWGPRYKRNEWGKILAKNINTPMKRSRPYTWSKKNEIASTVLHGIGPKTWYRDRHWCPDTVGIEDMMIPSNTLTSLENLSYFGIQKSFTAAQLKKMTSGETVDQGWNKAVVAQILAKLQADIGSNTNQQDYENWQYPEKTEEDWKQNSGFWGSDQVPTVRTYDFYYLETEAKTPYWKRKIVIDRNNQQLSGIDVNGGLLYDGRDRNYGDSIDRILYAQIADGAVVAPFRWHSVRSLGYLLYAVCHLQNRLRCKFTDATFESMLWYFRNVGEGDRERLERVDLAHLGIIPDGLSFVPGNERHTIDYELLNGAMSMHRQLIAESSASYTQDVDNGTQKEQTATEVMAKVNSANALVGSMLSDMYDQSIVEYREIARRFCTLSQEDCVAFRRKCMEEGVPEEVFQNLDAWEIIPERVLGNGNKMLEVAQSDRLMQVRGLLDPDAQRQVTHMYVEANTDDPLLADALVPIEQPQASTAVEKATLSWGTLVDGQPVVITDGINRIEYVDTLLEMLNNALGQIEQQRGMTTPERVQGLANVLNQIQSQIQIIAMDDAQKPRVKEWMDAVGRAQNLLKAYAQRIEQQQGEEQPQLDPAVAAKMQADVIQAQAKARIAEESAAQKRAHKDESFAAEQQRKNVALAGEMNRQGQRTQADIAEQDVKTAADITRNTP